MEKHEGGVALAPGDTTAVYEIFIKTTPERLWEAVTDPDMRARYTFGVRTESDWNEGSTYASSVPGVIDIAAGENLEVDPPRRLVQTMNALWSDDVKSEGTSVVTWEIEQVADSCRLTVVHARLRPDGNGEIYGGWPMILSGLKTLLETGEDLTTPGSLLYSGDVGLDDGDGIADRDRAGFEDAAVHPSEPPVAVVVHPRERVEPEALAERLATGVRGRADLEQRLAQPEPRPHRQRFLGEVEIDLEVVAGQVERAADQLGHPDVHQRDLGVEVALAPRPAVADEAVLDRHLRSPGRLVDALLDADADQPHGAAAPGRPLGRGPPRLEVLRGQHATIVRAERVGYSSSASR